MSIESAQQRVPQVAVFLNCWNARGLRVKEILVVSHNATGHWWWSLGITRALVISIEVFSARHRHFSRDVVVGMSEQIPATNFTRRRCWFVVFWCVFAAHLPSGVGTRTSHLLSLGWKSVVHTSRSSRSSSGGAIMPLATALFSFVSR